MGSCFVEQMFPREVISLTDTNLESTSAVKGCSVQFTLTPAQHWVGCISVLPLCRLGLKLKVGSMPKSRAHRERGQSSDWNPVLDPTQLPYPGHIQASLLDFKAFGPTILAYFFPYTYHSYWGKSPLLLFFQTICLCWSICFWNSLPIWNQQSPLVSLLRELLKLH